MTELVRKTVPEQELHRHMIRQGIRRLFHRILQNKAVQVIRQIHRIQARPGPIRTAMEEKPKELPEKTDNKRNLKTEEIQKNLYFPRFLALQEIAFVKPKTLREDVPRHILCSKDKKPL